jgi:hypothetical protein
VFFWQIVDHRGSPGTEVAMPTLDTELRLALRQNDISRINYLRETGLDLLARYPGALSPEDLDYLARACMKCRDAVGLRAIADELPLENVSRSGNFSLNDMTHLQLVRGFVFMQKRDFQSATRYFESAADLAGHFGDSGLQATARSYANASQEHTRRETNYSETLKAL